MLPIPLRLLVAATCAQLLACTSNMETAPDGKRAPDDTAAEIDESGNTPSTPTPTPTPALEPTPAPTPTVPQPPSVPPEVKRITVTPTLTKVRSETQVDLTWTMPSAGAPDHGWAFYYAPIDGAIDLSAAPIFTVADGSLTSATVSGLAPGSNGRLVVAGIYDTGSDSLAAPGAVVWTPYGTVGTPDVNTITWLAAPLGSDMAVFSDRFSMVWSFFYNPDFTTVFDKVPSKMDAPKFVWNSRLISGFVTTWDGSQDGVQLWTNGTNRFSISTAQGGVRLYNRLPLDPANVAPDRRVGAGTNNKSTIGNRGGHVCFDPTNDRFYLSDPARNRVLVFDGWPAADNPEAEFVLGQPDFDTFTANTSARSASTLSLSSGAGGPLHCYKGMLAVADQFNHRVLVWGNEITSNGQAADIIYGQSNATSGSSLGAGGIAQGGMNSPSSVLLLPDTNDGITLLVGDGSNNRVLEWPAVPTATNSIQYGGDYSTVYGQPDRTSNIAHTSPVTASGLSGRPKLYPEVDADGDIKPDVFWVNDAQYYVTNNGRTLKFQRGQSAAVDVYGQPTLTNRPDPSQVYAQRPFYWNSNYGAGRWASIDPGSQLLNVGGTTWRTLPEPPSDNADLNIGLGSSTFVGNKLWSASSDRILGYDIATPAGITSSSVATSVLGRKTLANAANAGIPDTHEYKLTSVSELRKSGNKLLALDSHRIAIWDLSSVADHKAITTVVGQPDKTTNAANQGSLSAATLSSPYAMAIIEGKLVVADSGNNRVLIWNEIPTSSGVAANVILGQTNGTTSATGTGLDGMKTPRGIAYLNGKLLVADNGNGRILVWDGLPDTSGTPAARAVDIQTPSLFALPAWANPLAFAPRYLEAVGQKLYIEQFGRILVMPDIFR